MITYNWQIQNMIRNVADGGVVVVFWSCFAFNAPYQTGVEGSVELEPDPSAEGFISYENLTEEQVFSWVYRTLNKSDVEEYLASKLQEQMNPTRLSGVPWGPDNSQS